MNFFDLHCDTMLRLLDGSSLADADAHLNLSKAQSFEKWAQIFALFVLDNKPGRDTAYDAYRRLYAGFIRQMRLHADRIVFCRSAAELEAAWAAGKHAALLSVENGAVLGGRLERLDELQRDGVRLLTLTWMGENELGFGGEAGGPLTDFGRSVVRALPQYGIVPDISHLSDEGAAEVFRLTDGPVIATHSNARRITGHHRSSASICAVRFYRTKNRAPPVRTYTVIWMQSFPAAPKTPSALERILTARRSPATSGICAGSRCCTSICWGAVCPRRFCKRFSLKMRGNFGNVFFKHIPHTAAQNRGGND